MLIVTEGPRSSAFIYYTYVDACMNMSKIHIHVHYPSEKKNMSINTSIQIFTMASFMNTKSVSQQAKGWVGGPCVVGDTYKIKLWQRNPQTIQKEAKCASVYTEPQPGKMSPWDVTLRWEENWWLFRDGEAQLHRGEKIWHFI